MEGFGDGLLDLRGVARAAAGLAGAADFAADGGEMGAGFDGELPEGPAGSQISADFHLDSGQFHC